MRSSVVTRGGQQYGGGRGGETAIDLRPEQGTEARNTADPRKHRQGAVLFPRRWRPASLHHELCLFVLASCASPGAATPITPPSLDLLRRQKEGSTQRGLMMQHASGGDSVAGGGGSRQRSVGRRSRCTRDTREIDCKCFVGWSRE